MYRATFLLIGLALAVQAQTPVISTVAGATGYGNAPVRGFEGDGEMATKATLALANVQNPCDPQTFEQTSHIAFDSAGNLYIADSNNQRIRRIGTNGVITTVAGSGDRPALASRCEATGSIGDGGDARSARLYNPADIAILPNGGMVIADQLANRIRQVSPSGVITTLAGNGAHNLYSPGIPATSSPMDSPSALAVDKSGVIYFAELHGNRIGRIGPDGRIVTVAGNGFPGYNGEGIPATSAWMTRPTGISLDAAGTLYIADSGNNRIRKVSSDGIITTFAGTGQKGFSGDGGAANAAKLDTPMDVKVDGVGNVYIADTGNHRVRRVSAQGAISTVAGTGESDRGRDFGDATTSALNAPLALAIDAANDVYVVDWQNYLVRKITFDGKPALTPGGVVDAAGFHEPVAPGAIVAFFGANLADSLVVSNEARWPTSLSEVSVEINGTPMPLYVVSSGQLAGQLPYGLKPGSAEAIVRSRGVASNTVRFEVAAQAVGIFGLPDGRAAAQNQDYGLNTTASPESRGNAIILYLTGLGEVSPAVPTGQASPPDRVSTPPPNSVSATVGGVAAEILYVGLTPGTIGLAQANIRIPNGVAVGSAVPVVITAGGHTSNAATISIR
jgi:uncharacterized protein (TIGR03437 family)